MIAFPDVRDGRPLRISATTYLAFRQCEAQAQARFRGRFPPESEKSFVGTLAHRIFARHLVSGPIEDLRQALREEIGAGLNSKMAAAGIHRPSQLDEAARRLGILYERFRRFPGEGFSKAEVPLQVEPSPGVVLVGKVDAVFEEVEGGLLLRDWKTGPLREPLEQLFYYACLWAWGRGEVPAAVEAVSVETGERIRQIPKEGDLMRVAETLAALVTKFRATWDGADAARTGGPWCRFCPLLNDCREGQAAVAVSGR